MSMLQRGHSGDGCVLASTLCKYDLRKGDLFVLSWARVRGVRRGSISSELLVCGGGVRSILLLPLVARCLETMDNMAHVCFYVCCSDCVGVCGDVMDVVFSVCIVTRRAIGAHVWEVLECRHADVVCFVLCASCGSSQCCILHDLQFSNAGRGCKRRPYGRGILQSRYDDYHECLLLFTSSCCCECFYHL